jgi:protein-S-isoprenylcysteine O-methyltransferase Ste14
VRRLDSPRCIVSLDRGCADWTVYATSFRLTGAQTGQSTLHRFAGQECADWTVYATSSFVILFLKSFLFTVLVPGTVAVYIPFLIVDNPTHTINSHWGVSQILALLPLLIGTAIYGWCLSDFAHRGRGTPAPIDAPKHLVVNGLYSYVRNPMYVGVLLIISGWSLFFQSRRILFYGIAVGFFFHLFIVFVEEPQLRKRFGESYLKYCVDVSRWIPKTKSSGD